MTYVSVDSLKSALGITDATDDVQLSLACERATAAVDSYLFAIRAGYVGFAAASNARTAAGSNTRTYSGTGDDTLFIDDADSIASVTVDDDAVDATSYIAMPLNAKPKRWLAFISSSTVGYTTTSTWALGTANVDVTGYWGLATVPNDVVETTLALAILYWRRMQLGSTPDAGYGPTGTVVSGSFIADTEARAILSSLDGWGVPTVAGA